MAVDPVRAQYETYPYPARDPKDEAKRLITGSPSHLRELTHWLFAGRLPQDRPFRVLVAGGGSGDALTMLAQQTADAGIDADIHYVDLSEATRKIAEARIAARGLTERVTFRTGSLLDAAEWGPFDYIDCCGVLHHLPVPQDGFRALAAALAPQGGMGVMVYGETGRTGVYETQAALRLLARDDEPPAKRVALAKRYLNALPASNRLVRNPLVRDHKTGGDAGLYDLLLHSTDRAYTVPQLEAEIAAAGLRTVTYIDPARYAPETYTREQDLRNRAAALAAGDRAALAEAMAGNMPVHIAYLTRADRAEDTVARIAPDAVPVFRDAETEAEFRAMPPGAPSLPVSIDGLDLALPLPRDAKTILDRIDGTSSLEQIRQDLPAASDWDRFHKSFTQLFAALNGFSQLFLTR
jgi:SAM-dependent methyltransferase